MEKKFCEWQLVMEEHSKENYTCGVYLAEGFCSTCPFTVDKIEYGHKYGKDRPAVFYITQTGKPIIGECQDFELSKGLTAKLKDVSDDKKLETLKELLKNSEKEGL